MVPKLKVLQNKTKQCFKDWINNVKLKNTLDLKPEVLLKASLLGTKNGNSIKFYFSSMLHTRVKRSPRKTQIFTPKSPKIVFAGLDE